MMSSQNFLKKCFVDIICSESRYFLLGFLFGLIYLKYQASQVAWWQRTCLPMQGLIPDQEDLLEKEMETHSSILAWRIPWTEEPGGLQSMGSQKSWTGLRDQTSNKTSTFSRRGSTQTFSTAIKIPNQNSPNPFIHSCHNNKKLTCLSL